MSKSTLLTLFFTLILLLAPAGVVSASTPSAPTAAPCGPDTAYDPACDVNHDGVINVVDVQLTADKWNQSGTWFGDNGHDHLGQTWIGDNTTLRIEGSYAAPYNTPLLLNNQGGHGLAVGGAGSAGVSVGTAGNDGFRVYSAGSPGIQTLSPENNGFEVAGAEHNGLFVGSARTGVFVHSVENDGVRVGLAGNPSSQLASSLQNGFEVAGAENNGLYVGRADHFGVYVDSAGYDGVNVYETGTPSDVQPSDSNNGFEVAGAQGSGLYVGRADEAGVTVNEAGFDGVNVGRADHFGVYVDSAGQDGVYVYEAGHDGFVVCRAGNVSLCFSDITHDNGFEVGNAEDYGVKVVYAGRAAFRSDNSGTNGIFVDAAGDSGIWIDSATNWAGNFLGNINVTGNCTGCRIAQFALNSGDTPLAQGDIVALASTDANPYAEGNVLFHVKAAMAGDPLIGIVAGKAEIHTSREDASTSLVARDGVVAQPGDYVSIIIYGPVQVKASAADGAITQGSKLAIGDGGPARALRTVEVEGIKLAESTSTLGMALESLDAGEGLIWVLVNVQ